MGNLLQDLRYGFRVLRKSPMLLATVLLASYLPARWATKVQPMVALRDE